MQRYSIRQEPGAWNALGKLKFVFPNSYNVYLHDTSSPELFEKQERLFSHGCIRVRIRAEIICWIDLVREEGLRA
jgi:murein L,D-transpeptidase YcbB/YkuD